MLSADELERYARHIVLREVGGPGQLALKEASVLVVGAGGLGAPALMYLAAAGVGQLGVVDDDIVSLSNLQRQIIHTTPDIGRPKVDSAAQQIHALNPHVAFAAHGTRLNADNAMSLIGGYDLVLDGSDNFETRYLVSDACFLADKPLVTASLGVFDGSLTTIHANSPRETLSRLETLVLMAGLDLPLKAIRQQIAGAINLIIQLNRLKDGSRKVVSLTEVIGMEGERNKSYQAAGFVLQLAQLD